MDIELNFDLDDPKIVDESQLKQDLEVKNLTNLFSKKAKNND